MGHRHHVHHNHPVANATPTLIASVRKLENLRNSRVLLLLDRPNSQIDECTYADIRRALEKVHPPKLDVLIQSHGGSPNDAFKIGRLLQERSGKFSVLIPEYAKSAATLISLGASEIVMTRDAELGPIDTQLPDSRESEGWISALQEFKGLEAVSSFCQSFLDATSELVQVITHRSVNDSVESASDFVCPLLRPLFEQVDPRSLGRFKRALEITESYGERLLRASGCDRQTARRIVHALVYDYPSHDFVIQHDEAAELGLPVTAADDQLEDVMTAVLDASPDFGYVGFVGPSLNAPRKVKPSNGVHTQRTKNGKSAPAEALP